MEQRFNEALRKGVAFLNYNSSSFFFLFSSSTFSRRALFVFSFLLFPFLFNFSIEINIHPAFSLSFTSCFLAIKWNQAGRAKRKNFTSFSKSSVQRTQKLKNFLFEWIRSFQEFELNRRVAILEISEILGISMTKLNG